MNLPSKKQLQEAWESLRKIHQRHLEVHGVIIPDAVHYSEKRKAAWLAILWHYRDQDVNKNLIAQIVMRDIDDAGTDQQVRHLKNDGWEIGNQRGVHRLDPFRTSHEFGMYYAKCPNMRLMSSTGEA